MPSRFKLFRLIAMAIALTGLILIWKSNSPDSMEGVQFDSVEQDSNQSDHPSKRQPQKVSPLQKPAPIAQQDPLDDEHDNQEPHFSMQEEVHRIQGLVAELPRSRPKLLQLINQPDPYAAKEVRPHTISEQMQMKMGAVKVMALRELMKNQSDLKQLSKDLRRVARTAQDPTIRRIAEAADDSLAQGRSFFDDFLDGLDSLPL